MVSTVANSVRSEEGLVHIQQILAAQIEERNQLHSIQAQQAEPHRKRLIAAEHPLSPSPLGVPLREISSSGISNPEKKRVEKVIMDNDTIKVGGWAV
jgi:hypothetical protein